MKYKILHLPTAKYVSELISNHIFSSRSIAESYLNGFEMYKEYKSDITLYHNIGLPLLKYEFEIVEVEDEI